MVILLSTFAASAVLALLLVHFAKTRWAATADHDLSGPQKFHAIPVPRVGGLSIVPAFALGCLLIGRINGALDSSTTLILLACGMPAFAAGLIEDFTKTVRPLYRLAATAISAALCVWVLGVQLVRTDIMVLDWLVSVPAGALLLTVFAVAGIANSVNIIDGFNGLASMCVIIMLAGIGCVAWQVGDHLLVSMALAGVGAVLGFFVWNFPAGRIFLGDGGAYFLGFFVAEMALLLLYRNPGVSPMFGLLVVIYPVFETVFSIYRRKFLRAMPPSVPDGIHLHSLIYRRTMRWAMGSRGKRSLTRRNSMTSPYLWALCMLSVVPAVFFWDNGLLLTFFLFVFALTYVSLYWRIVRFKSPRWLRRGPVRRRRVVRADNPQL